MSSRVVEVIKNAETIAGYSTYVDLIKDMIEGKKLISTAMKKEVDRVKAAVDAALAGENCVLVSSGDPGIYAMAGLALEICKERGINITRSESEAVDNNALYVEVVPGIPALASCSALLGAPLTHDFAVISLSDLLTPWEVIEKRIEGASMADFVMVIFNPKSKKRDWQLNKAQEIALKYRDGSTPVGIVKSAMRDEQEINITTLGELHKADVDMLTTVVIGNSNTMEYKDFLITPRGYSGKYDIK